MAVQNQMNAGKVPAMEMAEGLALLIAGAVLLTPGFVTDAFGFCLLIPTTRKALIAWASKRVTISAVGGAQAHPRQSHRPDAPIEGEFRRDD